MAFKDFDLATEVDPNTHLTPNGVKIDWTGVTRSEDVHCYFDEGAAHFDGDFEHLLEVYADSASTAGGNAVPWAITNIIDDRRGIRDASGDYIDIYTACQAGNWNLYLAESDGGTPYQDGSIALSYDTLYYLKVVRNEAVGAQGTAYCYIYSDSGRTVLVDTVSVALHTSKKDYRYYFGFNSNNSGGAQTATGYTQNHNLQEVVGAPSMLSLLGAGHA